MPVRAKKKYHTLRFSKTPFIDQTIHHTMAYISFVSENKDNLKEQKPNTTKIATT